MNAPIKSSSSPQMSSAYGQGGIQPDEAGSFDFDLMGIYRALRKRLGLILAVTFGLTALVMVFVLQLTPLYTAETLILLDQQKTQVVDVESVMSGLTADSPTVDSQVEILRSRNVAKRVVEDLDLVNDPEFNAALRAPSPLRYVDPRYWLSQIFVSDGAVDEAAARERTLQSVVGSIVSKTSVSRRGSTYIMSLKFTSEDPVKAAKIANALADTYVLDQLEARFNATKQANEWLSKRLADLRIQVQDSERAAEIFRTQNGLESAGGTTINDQQLSELNAQLILAKTNLAEKQAKYSRAKQILASGGSIESVADVLQSQTITQLRASEAELARQQADLSTKYGPRHPAILNIDAQRKDIQKQIGREVQRIVGSIQNEAAIAQSRVDSLQKSLNELKGTSNENNQAFIQLRELEREAEANRSVYESFLNRFKETSQQSDLQTTDARIISPAIRPGGSSFPNIPIFAVLALMLSGALGVGIALLLEMLDSGLRTGQEIEDALGLAHLVSLPLVPDEKGADGRIMLAQEYLLAKPLSAYSESLRSLRSALALSNVDSPPKLVMFTSALPKEGKTTSAVSFARAAAQSGLQVLLIDCDLRHPSVHKAFRMPSPKAGLVELLAGNVKLEDVLLVDEASALDFLPIASGSANPPDVLGSGQMKRLLADMRDRYDLVVLDSAPVLPVSDSRVLSRIVDKTLFVVRWAETPKDAAASAVKELRNYGADIAGVVLSIVDTNKQAKYGYGDGGYYYRRYSRYYVN
ncbi:MAG: polysaccharide biosynthesis tyrosine autokinase [Rhizobiales bacterium]|nr:polysaccharide biosynthesis tyrosine autokinase [Hyphomicrobiales bacterium]